MHISVGKRLYMIIKKSLGKAADCDGLGTHRGRKMKHQTHAMVTGKRGQDQEMER
jgi:hypothetical protein